jgi:antitoxin CptB
MREVDFLLGRFADAELAGLDDRELEDFERLLSVPDPELLSWITGETMAPPEWDTPALRRVVRFHRH